jgi:hypothetical protein
VRVLPRVIFLPKAALKTPQSKRFARARVVACVAKRLDCGDFSAAVSGGFRLPSGTGELHCGKI